MDLHGYSYYRCETKHRSFSCFWHDKFLKKVIYVICFVCHMRSWKRKNSFVTFKTQKDAQKFEFVYKFHSLIMLSFQVNISSFCATHKASLFSMIIADPCSYLLTVHCRRQKEYLCKSPLENVIFSFAHHRKAATVKIFNPKNHLKNSFQNVKRKCFCQSKREIEVSSRLLCVFFPAANNKYRAEYEINFADFFSFCRLSRVLKNHVVITCR